MTTKPDTNKKPDVRIDTARRNLRIAAALRDMNLSKISIAAGMSRNGLGQFVNGRTSLSYANMLAVCDVLNIPISVVHKADAITETKIRLYQALERMPDHLIMDALAEIQKGMAQHTH